MRVFTRLTAQMREISLTDVSTDNKLGTKQDQTPISGEEYE